MFDPTTDLTNAKMDRDHWRNAAKDFEAKMNELLVSYNLECQKNEALINEVKHLKDMLKEAEENALKSLK